VGIACAYFFIFPLLFSFLLKFTPAHVVVVPEISQYLAWAMQLFLAFGLIFEIPVICVGLVIMGVTSVHGLVTKRPYFIVMAFVIAMLIGPPDVASQILLALPMCGLFEVGILMARWIKRNHATRTSS
jgi:sec-independent protein translocase protein TatC